MRQKTTLYQNHQEAGAKIVDFAGWDMPLHYGSQLEEHKFVRQTAGVFDVSHMGVVDIVGPQADAFLHYILANNITKLKTIGKALYTCMLNEQGGVIDDLIVYRLGDQSYRLVINASRREIDLAWLTQHQAGFAVTINLVPNVVILAIQGPEAIAKLASVFPAACYELIKALRPFEVVEYDDFCIARTGYTGEEGVEVILPANKAADFWHALLVAGIKPCGLGARDTLRLEAGLNLYGCDMDEQVTPLEANLEWTIGWEPKERQFIGRKALEAQKKLNHARLVGLILDQKGVLRNHQKIRIPDLGEGEITSGSYSPVLEQAIALARVPAATSDYCFVEIRGQQIPASVVKPPFVRHGKKCNFTQKETLK